MPSAVSSNWQVRNGRDANGFADEGVPVACAASERHRRLSVCGTQVRASDLRVSVRDIEELANEILDVVFDGVMHWRDFEILVDLIFRGAGLQRINELGGTMKSIDLDLVSPLTGERYAAQVKSQAGATELQAIQDAFSDHADFSRIYLVVHSPDPSLIHTRDVQPPFEILGPQRLAELTVRNGLTDWLVRQAG
jgi:hypothetical protein